MKTQTFYFNNEFKLTIIPDNGLIINANVEMPKIEGEFTCDAKTLITIMNILADRDVYRTNAMYNGYLYTKEIVNYDAILNNLKDEKTKLEKQTKKYENAYKCIKECLTSLHNAPWYRRISKKFWKDVINLLNKYCKK